MQVAAVRDGALARTEIPYSMQYGR